MYNSLPAVRRNAVLTTLCDLCKQQHRGPKILSSHQSSEGRQWQRVEKEKPGELGLEAEVGVILPPVFFGQVPKTVCQLTWWQCIYVLQLMTDSEDVRMNMRFSTAQWPLPSPVPDAHVPNPAWWGNLSATPAAWGP